VKINITDMTGRTLQQQTVILQPGLNDISISSKGLSAGAYMVTAYVAGEKPQTLRLIKQ
jgi:hypothetical protein